MPDLPGIPDLGRLTDIPGLPTELADVPNLLQDLGLGDLGNLEDLPGLDSLPFLRTQPGALVLRGPHERRIGVGQRIPGTDIVLRGITEDGAVFEIAGMRSVRTYADSLDFDGQWPGISGVSYNLRLRLYQIGRDSVRAVGVHQVEILNAVPLASDPRSADMLMGTDLRFPATWGVTRGEMIPGTTLNFVGGHDRGAEIGGLGEGVYPYFKVGDSVRWQGQWRPEITVDYQLRVLAHGDDTARVGGTVRVFLPGE